MMRAAAAYAATHIPSSRVLTVSTIGRGRAYHQSLYAGLSQRLPSSLPNHGDDDDNDNKNALSLQQYNQQLRLQSLSQQQHPIYTLSTQQVRNYHSTTPVERGAAIVLGLGAVAATAKAGQYAVRAYEEWKASQPEEPPEEEKAKEDTSFQSKEEGTKKESKKDTKKEGEKRENIFAKFFNVGVGSKYYEGGFEEKMTKREAALILGVRESSTPKRIKEAHRKLLILNHPDTGGSTYLSGKINEAKELLLKGKKL